MLKKKLSAEEKAEIRRQQDDELRPLVKELKAKINNGTLRDETHEYLVNSVVKISSRYLTPKRQLSFKIKMLKTPSSTIVDLITRALAKTNIPDSELEDK